MDIALYISELLKDHNEISLSGIGTFCKRNVSARYDRTSGVISPPSEEIVFKTGDSNNGELVRYVSNLKNISDAGARYFINKFVDHIRQSLASEGRADLSPLGVLHIQDGHLYMSPKIIEGAQFGLKEVKDPAFSQPPRKPAEAAPAEIPPAIEAMPETEEKQKSGSLWQAVAVILILVIGAGGLAYVFYPEFFNLRTDRPLEVNKQPVRAVTTTPPHKDTLKSKADSTVPAGKAQVVSQKPDSAVQKKAEQTAPPQEHSPAFEVIGASFGLRSEAENYIRVMKSKGIKATIVEDARRPKFKISLGSYSTYEEANQEKRRIQASFNKEAWILTVKDKVKQ